MEACWTFANLMLVSFGTCLEARDLPNAEEELLTAPLKKFFW